MRTIESRGTEHQNDPPPGDGDLGTPSKFVEVVSPSTIDKGCIHFLFLFLRCLYCLHTDATLLHPLNATRMPNPPHHIFQIVDMRLQITLEFLNGERESLEFTTVPFLHRVDIQ